MNLIKFRALNDDGEWLSLTIDDIKDGQGSGHFYEPYCLFTGLYDKNGKEIYEGDLVKIPTKINQDRHGEWSVYEITIRAGLIFKEFVYSEKMKKFPRNYMFGNIEDEIDMEWTSFHSTAMENEEIRLPNVEVIGNIHTNPELLKQGDE